MLSSGFTNSPVTKVCFFGIIASSILASITDTKYLFPVHVVPHLWRYKQFWRLLTWQTCYLNSAQLLFASMSLYHLRMIERLWGSRKFASFLTTTLPPTLLLPPLLVALVLRPLSLNFINILPAGPTPLLFALLAQYHAAIPTIYKYRIATSLSPNRREDGVTFSDKSIVYVLAGQLALSQLPGSAVAAAVGWLVGVAWRNEIGPGGWARWRVPGWVVGEKKEDGFEGLRRRLEGEGAGVGASVGGGG